MIHAWIAEQLAAEHQRVLAELVAMKRRAHGRVDERPGAERSTRCSVPGMRGGVGVVTACVAALAGLRP